MLSILINIGLLILILIALILLMIFRLIVACITAYIMYMVSGEKNWFIRWFDENY